MNVERPEDVAKIEVYVTPPESGKDGKVRELDADERITVSTVEPPLTKVPVAVSVEEPDSVK